jgi:hypothetical protein
MYFMFSALLARKLLLSVDGNGKRLAVKSSKGGVIVQARVRDIKKGL